MQVLVGLITGILFSIGLSVSGMVNPNKVINFLDIFGNWDPALMFVMVGGVIVNIILFKFILKRKNPIFASEFSLPTAKDIDKKLIAGSSLFGIGWGIGGVCPGPGIANLFTLNYHAITFCVFMIFGMFIFRWFNQN